MTKIKDYLKNKGYIKKIPEDANIHEYEKIIIKKNQKKEVLYRLLSKRKSSNDDQYNFSNSLKIYNSYL